MNKLWKFMKAKISYTNKGIDARQLLNCPKKCRSQFIFTYLYIYNLKQNKNQIK